MSRRIEVLVIAVTVAVMSGCKPADTPAAYDPAPAIEDEVSVERPHLLTPTGERVELEIARSDQQRARGLMFRESLPLNHGMLFVFAESEQHGFWMKNTFIPLDMLWLDEDGRIVEIQRNIQPCSSDPCPSYAPDSPGLYVLELAAGEADRLGLAEGGRLDLRNIESTTGG